MTDPDNWPPKPWDELDQRMPMHGVFGVEEYSAHPLALFRSKEDAEAWVTLQTEGLPEDERINIDLAVCPVYGLTGLVWNSYDPPPADVPSVPASPSNAAAAIAIAIRWLEETHIQMGDAGAVQIRALLAAALEGR